jgi:chromosome segregation ATPase
MTQKTSADVEMAIVLPLDVAANKLMKIEEELRHLNTKVLSFEQERETRLLSDLIEARLERIHETLDSIRERLSDINAEIQPTSANISRASTEAAQATARQAGLADADSLWDRKPQPGCDD